MLQEKLTNKRLILASASPRRKALMQTLDIPFEVMTREVDETDPGHLPAAETACLLAERKASAFNDLLSDPRVIVMTADTVVWHRGEHLAKPQDREDAIRMLNLLSDDQHEVVTGVCIISQEKKRTFHSTTRVWFKPLLKEEISYYVDHYKPFDKAGAYGVQEWIGHAGISRIEGSYFNVVGLPIQQVYFELCEFLK